LFPAVKRILHWQLGVIALIVAFSLGVWGWSVARSVLLGGLVGFLPNAFFAIRFATTGTTRTAQQVVNAFYAGEAMKLVLTAGLFALVFHLPDVIYPPLFAGFTAVLATFWLALLFN
jgi:ATP synthase protein I